MEDDTTIDNPNVGIHHLLFCRSGRFRITSTLFQDQMLNPGEVVFVPRGCHCSGTAIGETTILVHKFNNTVCSAEKCILAYLYSHRNIKVKSFGKKLNTCTPLLNIVEGIETYISDQKNDQRLWQLKHQEMIWVFTQYYTADVLRDFFHPMTDEQVPFKNLVQTHYRKAQYTEQLAELCGYGIYTFRRIFKREFGLPAHQWLLKKRAEGILYKLSLVHIPFVEIIDEFNFSSPQQFSYFCKQYLGDAPSNIRQKYTADIE